MAFNFQNNRQYPACQQMIYNELTEHPMETSTGIKPLISIIICTYNNADSLQITLNQLSDQALLEPEMFELLVIDNNSSDHTAQIISTFTTTNLPYYHHTEPRQGLSHARNTGIEKAQGQYILFTDDDAEIYPNWLSNYLAKVRSTKADCIFGKIEVMWDQPQPWWYDDSYAGFFAVVNHGEREIAVKDKSKPFFGKNFCIKKSFLTDMGGFDPELGRKGTELAGGEEILVFYKLIEQQLQVIYYPDLTVGHRLKPREYTEENIRKQYIACAKPILQIAKTQPGKRMGTRPLGVLENQIKDVFSSAFLLIQAKISGDRKKTFLHSMRFLRSTKVISLWIKNK